MDHATETHSAQSSVPGRAPKGALDAALRRGAHGALGILLLAAAVTLSVLGVEPYPVFWYPLAWLPTLLVLDALVARLGSGRSPLLDEPKRVFSLAIWSVPFWLAFEAANLRLRNWFYVSCPRDLLNGRILLVVSFATVLPALLLCRDLAAAAAARWGAAVRTPPLRLTPRRARALAACGALCVLLPLLEPRLFFALIWIAPALLLEPLLRRLGGDSILDDLERGDGARVASLLAGALLAGLLWEVLNVFGRCRWIYTVPFFERAFGVEMPPLGFLGFLPFALSADSFVRTLEALALSPPPRAAPPSARPLAPPWRFFVAPAAAALFCVWSVAELEEWSVESRDPHVVDLPGVDPALAASLELRGLGPAAAFLRATADADALRRLAAELRVPERELGRVRTLSRLAAFRGLGARNTRLLVRVGVRSLEDLARTDPETLPDRLRAVAARPERIVDRRIRGFARAARRTLEGGD